MNLARTLPLLAAGLVLTACHSPVAPDAGDPGPSSPTTSDPATTAANFRCGDLLLGVRFDAAGNAAKLSWSGHLRTLPRVDAASGARYADDHGTEFRNNDDGATFTPDGSAPVACNLTDDTSPWDEARARGVSLRAIGNEPGWLAEITPGDPPSLKALLDYGERQVDVAALSKDESLPGFSGNTADGVAVSLRIVEGACSDGMSDQSYPASIQLKVGADTFNGCGARLDR